MNITKIKSIKSLGKKKAYNIEVKKNHNFMLSNGILTHNTSSAQNALRNLMEEVPNTVWILTGNYENKIVDAIKNRCFHYKFKQPGNAEIKKRLQFICKEENIILTEEMIERLIEVFYPSIRSMVKELQRLKNLNREITLNDISSDSDELVKLYATFKDKKFMQTRQLAIDSGIDYSTLIISLHDKFLWNKNISPETKLNVINILADSLRFINSVPNQAIEFESMISKCFQVM